jgi:hypothetical protein
MVLPVWLRRAEVADQLIPRLQAIATSTYDGALFCGEALLERLPLSIEIQDKLIEQVFIAIRTWNICENALLTIPKANPSALVRRLVRRSDFRSRIVHYLTHLREGYCPFTALEFVRLLSELDEESVLRDLAESGTPFIRANAASALLDSGHSEEAISAAISVLKDLEPSIRLRCTIIDALSEAGEQEAISRIAVDWEIDTPVRIHAAAHLWRVAPEEQSKLALRETFFGTAHDNDLDLQIIESLIQSGVIWSQARTGEVAPITLKHAAEKYLKETRDTQPDEAGKLARELLLTLVSDPTSGVTALSVADLIEPAIGRDATAKLLWNELQPKEMGEKLGYALALAQRGDFSLAFELQEQSQDDSIRTQATKIIGGQSNSKENVGASSDAGPSPPSSAQVLDAAMHAYAADPSPETLREMFAAEVRDAQQPEPRYRAAYFVNRALFRTGRTDLLRQRLADPGQSAQARGSALTMLANLGDAEIVAAQLSDSSLPKEARGSLAEALELIGLREQLPGLRSSIVLDREADPGTREMQFRALMKEDGLLAEQVAGFVVDQLDQPRSVRRGALIYLAAAKDLNIDRLAAFAAEEPASCGDLLHDLVNVRPFCTGAALAIVLATSSAPIPHLHFLDQLVPEQPSADEINLMIELIGRVDFTCHGSADLFARITRALDNATEFNETQRERLKKVAVAALLEGNRAVDAAVLCWRLVDLESWIQAIVHAVEIAPSQYPVLATGLSIPIFVRGMLADRLAGSQVTSVRALSAVQLCEAERIDDARIAVMSVLCSGGPAADLAVFDSKFIETTARVGCENEAGDAIALALTTALANGPLHPSPDLHAVFLFILRHASLTRKNEASEIVGAAGDASGGLMKFLWQAAVAECSEDYYNASRAIWALCLRLPDQIWLRQAARALAAKGGGTDWIIALLEDEYSFFRRKNQTAPATSALEELRSLAAGRHIGGPGIASPG